ncbi:histidine kinase [Paenibacillus sp. H1-7]|uniref:sensor histidine kinase n=1 Tax=Paenibacillus sp. H1-7 TaxID=2282849 RepID=UPI001EF92B18|nr:histidine kinase [Paenibacillus sp. H1-7]
MKSGASLKQKLMLLIGISTLMIFTLQIYYYASFYSLTEDKENVHTSKIMKQVEERLLSFMQDIKDAALASSYNTIIQDYLGSDDPIYRLKLNKVVIEIMSGIKSSNKNIKSIMLVDKKGHTVGASNPFDYVVLREIEKQYMLPMNKQEQFYGKVFDPKEMEKPAYFFVHPIFSTLNDPNDAAELGTCVVIYKSDMLDRMVMDTKATPNSMLFILDNQFSIVSSDEISLKETQFDQTILEGVKNSSEHKAFYYQRMNHIQVKDIEALHWKIISLIPINEMTDKLRAIRNMGFIIGIVMTLLIFIMGYFFIRSVTQPLGRIIRFVNFIGNNGGKRRMKMPLRNEIGILATEINKMLDKMDETNEKFVQANVSLYQMELAKKQAELSFLQSQINPHFLYNTLECLRSIGLANRIKEIVEISTAMAKIFRYSIKEDPIVHIASEVKCIQDYLRIMSIRYMEKFRTEILIEETIMNMRIPKMILQPIVENAVYHGLERKNNKGTLTIKGFVMQGNCVRFEFIDDGKGIEEEELISLRERLSRSDDDRNVSARGVGLLNIQRRIQLAFGERYGIEIYSKVNAGTTVVLQIPVVDQGIE